MSVVNRVVRPLILALWATIGVLSFSIEARAQHFIGPGHESEILALFEPHGLGDEVAGGFALWNVAIERDRIVITLRAGDGRESTVTLMHPNVAPEGSERTASFAVVGRASGGAARAQEALVTAIRQNDSGGFWERAADSFNSRQGLHPMFSWGAAEWIPIDGIAVIFLVYVLALLLAGRLLLDAPRWMGPALAATVAAGALVRLALSPATFLGAWPWSRLYPHIHAVATGDWISALAEHAGHPFALTDVMMWTNFAYAVAMPLVLFSHATYLLRDVRAGLAAALAIAFLPQHVRYSLSEDGFVASLVLTSLAFALIHGWLRDPSPLVRWLLLLALPVVLYPGYLLRPLNILFVLVYAGAILALHRETAPPWRRAVALVLVLAVGAGAALIFLRTHTDAVQAAGEHDWLWSTLRVLASPRLLVMSDPMRTPPVLIALAVVGAVLTWRAGERWLVVFLAVWLLLFVVAHAFVVQETMQPRYHLHLVVPFLLLAASAVPRLTPRYGLALAGAAALMVASPWVHRDFIRDIDYAEMHEYELVRRARDLVPDDCTVVEYSQSPEELRFARIGALIGNSRAHRFRSVAVLADGSTGRGSPSVDELLRDPPSCLYLYEGLQCFRERPGGRELQARGCTALRHRIGERMPLESVLEATVPARLYDMSNDGRVPEGDPSSSAVLLRLDRVRTPAPDAQTGTSNAP